MTTSLFSLSGRLPCTVAQYIAQPHVRQRIREYCGLEPGSPSAAVFLGAQPDEAGEVRRWEDTTYHPLAELDRLLDRGGELTRSLWDTDALLFFLDIDHCDPDHPAEAFLHAAETFRKLEAVHEATRSALREFGLAACDLMTGEGYHFTARIPFASPAFNELAELAPQIPDWLADHVRRKPPWATDAIGATQARACTGLGMVMEFLAHDIVRRAAAPCELPLVVNSPRVGFGPHGRESISLDLSAFTDPLDIRQARTAFSVYQKSLWLGVLKDVPHGSTALAPLAVIPRADRPLSELLEIRADLGRAAELAAEASGRIPTLGTGLLDLVRRYRASSLARFHREFYARTWSLEDARQDRRRLAAESLPQCIRACFDTPNDLLLRPEYLQNLTRLLVARGWPARRIAALIGVVYQEEHGWGGRWRRMNRRVRAEVYVRAFAGMIATGVDEMVDFNCFSTQEKGMCPGTACGHELKLECDRWRAGLQ